MFTNMTQERNQQLSIPSYFRLSGDGLYGILVYLRFLIPLGLFARIITHFHDTPEPFAWHLIFVSALVGIAYTIVIVLAAVKRQCPKAAERDDPSAGPAAQNRFWLTRVIIADLISIPIL